MGRPPTWDERSIVAAMRSWALLHGHPPRRRDMERGGPEYPSGTAVYRVFGSWGAALVAAGFDVPARAPRRPGGWDEQAILDAFADWAERFGGPPRLNDWNPSLARRAGQESAARFFEDERPRYPLASTVGKRFGSWNRALAAAGHRSTQAGLKRDTPRARRSLPGTHTTAWTGQEVLDALRAEAAVTGRAPRFEDWTPVDPHGRRPTTPVVQMAFGSWNEALRAAGLPLRNEQSVRRATAAMKEAAVSRYLAGSNSSIVAGDFGVGAKSVLDWVRAAGGTVRPSGRRRAMTGPETTLASSPATLAPLRRPSGTESPMLYADDPGCRAHSPS